jgi:hypothetical protein
MTMLRRFIVGLVIVAVGAVLHLPSAAQAPLGNEQYAFKIYAVNSGFYPIVQVYMRTWDQNRDPLVNVNYANIGLMVKGKNYDPAIFDPATRMTQYSIETLQNRQEGFRTVFVIDCSLSMAGKPFADAQNALMKYVEVKRPADQIAVIAIRDTDQGYELVSGFEKDPTLLYQRISEIICDGQKTRLYDAVASAMELCATASQGGTSNADSEHAVLSTIVVLSDGNDEGSAVARDELMNRIGQLPIPIPIFSLAYSNRNKAAFGNLEALSKGSFGRYWTHEDSQSFAATVQAIHQINLADYVLTFRAYQEVDGAKHPFKVGISYPSNTGRFVYGDGEFEAIDSPAKYVQEARVVFEQLQAMHPPLANNCPYVGCATGTPVPAPAPVVTPPPAQDTPAPVVTPPQPDPAPEVAPEPTKAEEAIAEKADAETTDSPVSFIKKNGGLIGLGAGMLALIVAILGWVKKGGDSGGSSGGTPPTYPGTGGSGTGSHRSRSDRPASDLPTEF